MKISDFKRSFPKIAVIEGQFTFYITLLIMVMLPLHYQYLPPLMILLCIGRIIEASSSMNSGTKFNKETVILCGLFIVFFIWQFVTVIYSENSKLAWANVFGRLSLLIFPLAYFNPGYRIIEQKFLLLRIFVVAICCYLLFCYGYALSRSLSIQNGKMLFDPHPVDAYWVNYFFELEFTRAMHPSYLSMYVLLSILVSFESFYYFEERHALQFSWFFIAVFLLGSLYFISSRAGILAAMAVVPIYLIIKIITVKRFRLFWCFFLIVISLSFIFVKGNEKVGTLLNSFSSKGFTIKDDRFVVWKSAFSRIKSDPLLGVGIGDVRSELTKIYENEGESELAAQRLNAHNQFLETMLEGGIIEMIFIVAIFLFMMYVAIRQKNTLFGLYIVMMIVFFMFETTLYRLAGVAFFSLFSFILPLQKKNI